MVCTRVYELARSPRSIDRDAYPTVRIRCSISRSDTTIVDQAYRLGLQYRSPATTFGKHRLQSHSLGLLRGNRGYGLMAAHAPDISAVRPREIVSTGTYRRRL
jgi:hypothetical protein